MARRCVYLAVCGFVFVGGCRPVGEQAAETKLSALTAEMQPLTLRDGREAVFTVVAVTDDLLGAGLLRVIVEQKERPGFQWSAVVTWGEAGNEMLSPGCPMRLFRVRFPHTNAPTMRGDGDREAHFYLARKVGGPDDAEFGARTREPTPTTGPMTAEELRRRREAIEEWQKLRQAAGDLVGDQDDDRP